MPITQEQVFQTVRPNQKAIHIKVYQGEAPIASANTLLGDFLIEGLTPETLGGHPNVNVRFDFDVNGMLHVSVKDQVSNTEKSVSVQTTQARLTPSQSGDQGAARNSVR